MKGEQERLEVVVTCKEEVATDIHLFGLERADGESLPDCEPGAHITVETPSGDNRWYSVCRVGSNRRRYWIAVKREADGRGGSISMADDVDVGSVLNIGVPENEFPLVDATSYLLIAGGIGITPIYSMWKHLVESGHTDFDLIYLTRSPETAPFLDELSHSGHRVTVHHSEGSGGRYDLWDLLAVPKADKHIYCCGPKSLMTEVKDMTGHWPSSRLHFEDFKPVEAVRTDDKPFRVRLAHDDSVIEVGKSETLLHALRRNGHRVLSSCESGTCGSCKLTYLEGSVEHRDLVLDDDEQKCGLMACVSRAAGDEITIDLGTPAV